MNNTIGERCEKTEEFAKMLERRTGLEVIFMDERLSTVSAHKSMLDGDLSRAKRYEIVDKVAAVFILQTYLDMLANQN